MSEYHQPVMLKECLEGLNINPAGVYVDVTFGGGGHSAAILKQIKKGKLVAFDQDADAAANILKDKRFVFAQHNFRYLSNFLKYHQVEKIDGLLADLGVSSHHFNAKERGFSFRFDAELDMRMNQSAQKSAKDVLNTYSAEKLGEVFKQYGEIKNGRHFANIIVSARVNKKLRTIGDLLAVLEGSVPKKNENQFLAKIFQAIRIEVNEEMEALKEMLTQTVEFLAPGGRLVVMSYHSLEDRLVTNFFKSGSFDKEPEKDLFGRVDKVFKIINSKVIVPSEEEIKENNRARSAKLRIAEKL